MVDDTSRHIEQYIELSPHRSGRDEARLIGSRVPVWTLVGYLRAVNGDVERVAADYDIPSEAVQAALSYYEQHKALIDARLAANEAPESGGTPVLFGAA